MERVASKANTGPEVSNILPSKKEIASRLDLPRAGTMAEISFPLIIQLGCYVAEATSRLNGSNIRRRIQRNSTHPIQFDNQMPVLSTQSKRRVAVSSSLGADLDTELGGAGNGSLDIFDFRCHNYCRRCVRQPLVERSNILVPARTTLRVDGNRSRRKAVVDGGGSDEAAGG
jgi:hypothetical protein